MKRSVIFLLLLLLAAPAYAQLAELGINPLQVEIGSRPLAMGGAFAGLADDAARAGVVPEVAARKDAARGAADGPAATNR